MPEQIEFYFGGQSKNFFIKCASLGLNNENENFIYFLSSDFCSSILRESKISISVKTGNFNTNESLYDFLLNQQDEKKKIIDAALSYSGSFREYLTKFLLGIDAETDDRFDTLKNKNVKYLFLKYNKFPLSNGLPTVSIRRSVISEDRVTLEEIQNKNWQYLIESLIEKVERGDYNFGVRPKKESRMIKSMEKNY